MGVQSVLVLLGNPRGNGNPFGPYFVVFSFRVTLVAGPHDHHSQPVRHPVSMQVRMDMVLRVLSPLEIKEGLTVVTVDLHERAGGFV